MDNITNLYKGLDKELLDMTYGDKYYRDVINPAKLGKGPLPSRMEMIGQNLKNFGPVKAMFIGAQPGKYGERANPTKAASSFLNKVGSVAKFGLNRVAPIFSILAPTELGSSELTEEDRQNMMKNNNMSMGIMDPNLLDDNYYTKGELYNIDDTNKIPGFTDKIKSGIETVGNKLGSVGDYIKGGGIIGQALQGLGNAFEYRGGIGYVDEYGNFISAEDIDKQNARGGYYTDAARASRRRAREIQRYRDRGADEEKGRFKQLLKDQELEDTRRQAAFDSIMDQGNYQQKFYDSLNDGAGSTAVSGNPNTSGAGDAPGYSGPSPFKKGGIVNL